MLLSLLPAVAVAFGATPPYVDPESWVSGAGRAGTINTEFRVGVA